MGTARRIFGDNLRDYPQHPSTHPSVSVETKTPKKFRAPEHGILPKDSLAHMRGLPTSGRVLKGLVCFRTHVCRYYTPGKRQRESGG